VAAVELVINSSGDIRCVYGEEVNLSELGRLSIQRGSHVEPTADGQWTADMSPVQGPQLGPFDCRTQALEAEVAWLNQYWLPQ
jgi:hypothetical protein